MLGRVKKYIEENNFFSEGDAILACVSGGADSVCLLCMLRQWQQEKNQSLPGSASTITGDSLIPTDQPGPEGALPISLYAVHVNHQMRDTAKRDEDYVRRLCEQMGVPLFVRTVDVKGYIREHGYSSEEAARILRYQAFNEVAEQIRMESACQQVKIAVAHTKNDNAETVLFHLFRGTGLKGLTGIPPKRERIVRPLLCLDRREIEQYLQSQGLDYCVDETNLSDDFSRNRIRHNILPEAEQYINHGVVQRISDMTGGLLLAEDYIEQQISQAELFCCGEEAVLTDRRNAATDKSISATDKSISETGKSISATDKSISATDKSIAATGKSIAATGKSIAATDKMNHAADNSDTAVTSSQPEMLMQSSMQNGCLIRKDRFLTLHPYIQQRLLLYLIAKQAGSAKDISTVHVKEVRNLFQLQVGKRITLPYGCEAVREYDGVRLRKRKQDDFPADNKILNISGVTEFNGYQITTRIFPWEHQDISKENHTKWFDYDRIENGLCIRFWEMGDSLVINERGEHQALKSFFKNNKVPSEQRRQIPIIAMEHDVLWIYGQRISTAYRITDATKNVLEITIAKSAE